MSINVSPSRLWLACLVAALTSVAFNLDALGLNPWKPAPEIPVGLQNGALKLMEILNTGDLWNLGALIHPNLSAPDVVKLYLKSNPTPNPETGPVIRSRVPDYKLEKSISMAPKVWIIEYGQFGPKGQKSSVWVKSGDFWYLKGIGWDFEFASNWCKEYLSKRK